MAGEQHPAKTGSLTPSPSGGTTKQSTRRANDARQVAANPACGRGEKGGWFVYVLRCADDTLYTGVTTDVARRLREHNAGGRLGARYTRARRPVQLAWQERMADKAAAYRREAAIKKLSREAKLAFLPSPIETP